MTCSLPYESGPVLLFVHFPAKNKGPVINRASRTTSAVGSCYELGQNADGRSANAALQHWRAPHPSHDRLCHDARQQNDEPWRHYRGARLLYCVRLWPFFSPWYAPSYRRTSQVSNRSNSSVSLSTEAP